MNVATERSGRLKGAVAELRELGADALREGRLEEAKAIVDALLALEPLGLNLVAPIEPQDATSPEALSTDSADKPQPEPTTASDSSGQAIAPESAPSPAPPDNAVDLGELHDSGGQAPEPRATRASPKERTETTAKPASPSPPSARQAGAERRATAHTRKSLERFFAASKPLIGAEGLRLAFELRGAICLGRAVLDGGKFDEAQQLAISEEIDRLAQALEATPYREFFGVKRTRRLPTEVWEQFAQAYQCLGAAFDCMEWLETEAFIEPEEERRLVSMCAAAEAAVHKLVEAHTVGVVEEIQRDLHEQIRGLAEDRGEYIEWWKSESNGGPTLKNTLAEANHLDRILTQAKSKSKRRLRSEIVLEKLLEVLEDETSDTFANDLVACIRENLEAGTPPSNRMLRDLALPYRALIEEVGEPKLSRLVAYLREDETKAIASHRVPVEIDLPETAESIARRERIRSLLKGKVALFVGGNPQEKKRRELQQALGLQELIWPDSDETTHCDRFLSQIDKVDLVCLMIRWARHGRRGVLDEAKSRGKLTAVLPRGLGVNRVLLDLDDQLTGNSLVTSKA